MTTQWHPLFARLLGLLLDAYYQIEPDVPVSDLPRRGDLFLLRKTGSAEPPFTGLWMHLTDWNLFEFKGPTDAAEEADLELLMHVGTGIAYRFNEDRRQRGEESLANRHISFWYLAPALGETFLGAVRTRVKALTYATGGLWQGRAWGHPVFFLSYRDAPVEPDTIPLHFLAPAGTAAPQALAALLAQRTDLLQRYEEWLFALHPNLWKEIRTMIKLPGWPTPDYSDIEKYIDIATLVRALPKGLLIRELVAQAATEIHPEQLISALGAERVLNALGVEQALELALSKLTTEERRQLAQRLLNPNAGTGS
jgi:hypothetical protein